ncbi:hypothetical protein [Kordia zhangzhouensis]|uniref:hypothetical protein n=1 Tax=Kordia zhangzhouensis TaxID=1620405 RepID=UPI000629B700|nr:hypothetical protein [Kordia zhangzhouensis]
METIMILSVIIVLLFGALVYTLTKEQRQLIDDSKAFCSDYSQYPYDTLKAGLIGDMISIYENYQLNAIKTVQHIDSESIILDLDKVQKFLYHIKQGVKIHSKNLEKEKLGLRFYYAAYPKKSTWGQGLYEELGDLLESPITQNYEDKHTLVIVPIRENEQGEVVDFHPYFPDTYENGLNKYRRPQELLGTQEIDQSVFAESEVMALTGTSIDNLEAINHGGLYPPHNSRKLAFKN